jgi:hypothetical protein
VQVPGPGQVTQVLQCQSQVAATRDQFGARYW